MYFNRELSWLKFNERVLNEASNTHLTVMERLQYNAIFSSNLDEFFMVRVASIKEQIKAGYQEADDSGYTPEKLFDQIHKEVTQMIDVQHRLTDDLLDSLKHEGFKLVRQEAFDEGLLDQMAVYFKEELSPVLTPMAVDISRPFPIVKNKDLYIACKLLVSNEHKLALVQVPSSLDRLVSFKIGESYEYVLLEDIIMTFISQLFNGNAVIGSSVMRLTRNADLDFIGDNADDLLMVIEEAVKKRQDGDPIRLELSDSCDQWIVDQLKEIYNLPLSQIYSIPGIMDLTMWFNSKRLMGDHRKASKYKPRKMPYMHKKDIFRTLSEEDVFIHHPYESFDYVVDFIKQASKDPDVVAIKQTLYRVDGDSSIIKALGKAATAGKQVTVLVELMARFDEENNIEWAKKLESKGVHVVYGVYGYKTHSKITLVVRKEGKTIKRYVHLGTGNYNSKTAKRYTDMCYLTSNEDFGEDASQFFNMIFGFTNAIETEELSVAPFGLREKIYELIDKEIRQVHHGHEGLIIAKMNSLVDKEVIDKLYEASCAGVKIRLIVRGICTLVPGVKGQSENIIVKSIIGEFLEHSRIYYFQNGHHPQVYLSSADLMTRNLDYRIELMFPVLDKHISNRIQQTLKLYLGDNIESWYLDEHGDYYQSEMRDKWICAQEILKSLDYDDDKSFVRALQGKF